MKYCYPTTIRKSRTYFQDFRRYTQMLYLKPLKPLNRQSTETKSPTKNLLYLYILFSVLEIELGTFGLTDLILTTRQQPPLMKGLKININ